MHRDEVSGSHEVVMSPSDDEGQGTSTKDDDSATAVTTGEDELSQGGPGTPGRKVKKRKEGEEGGSAKKKQKKVEAPKS